MTPLKRFCSSATQGILASRKIHGVKHSAPLSIVANRAHGCIISDVEGQEFLDFTSDNVVNYGHSHPKLLTAFAEQAMRFAYTSPTFHNDQLHAFQNKICEMFGYEKVIPLSTSIEAMHTAVKLSQLWAKEKKNIFASTGKIILAREHVWHGSRTLPEDVSPYSEIIGFDNIEDLDDVLSRETTCGLVIEPVQIRDNAKYPEDGYLKKVKALCEGHRVLFIADETNTGIGRTGKLLCSEWSDVKPDLVLLGGALTGGLYPMSCVLGSDSVIGLLKRGQVESTIASNAIACHIGLASLEVLEEEKLCENSLIMGELMRSELTKVKGITELDVHGHGLLNAVVVGNSAREVCIEMMQNGVLSQALNRNIVLLSPPLCVTEDQVKVATSVFRNAVRNVRQKTV